MRSGIRKSLVCLAAARSIAVRRRGAGLGAQTHTWLFPNFFPHCPATGTSEPDAFTHEVQWLLLEIVWERLWTAAVLKKRSVYGLLGAPETLWGGLQSHNCFCNYMEMLFVVFTLIL